MPNETPTNDPSILICGYRPAELAKIAKDNPSKANAISRCHNAMTNGVTKEKHRQMLHAACAAIGELVPTGSATPEQSKRTEEKKRALVRAYDAAFASGKGIVDEEASEQAQILSRELLAAGWDASVLKTGGA